MVFEFAKALRNFTKKQQTDRLPDSAILMSCECKTVSITSW